VVTEEEDDIRHTSGGQHGIEVLVVASSVTNTPPYSEGKQFVACALVLSSGLRKTPSYDTRVHMSVADDVVPLPEGRVEEEHGVQDNSRA
jgi:hypothetical protein